jgi:ribose transport system substrate-binding protein
MKRFVVAIGIVTGLAFGAPATAQTKPVISIIVKDTTAVYWRTVLAGARKAGQDLGVEVIELGAKSETDAADQISILEKAVVSKPAAIVIAPAQFAALGRPIDEAAKKVKIIGIDSSADTTAWISFVATDDMQSGRIAADVLAAGIMKTYADAEGDVAIVTAAPAAALPNRSAKGFRLQMAEKYRALNVLPDKLAEAQDAIGLSIMKGLTASDRDLRGVFVLNSIVADGASEVIYNKSSGDRIIYVVFGSDDKLVKSLQDGTIAGLVVQDPFRIGYEGIKTALAAARGEQVAARINIPAELITQHNINSARAKELLHPSMN